MNPMAYFYIISVGFVVVLYSPPRPTHTRAVGVSWVPPGAWDVSPPPEHSSHVLLKTGQKMWKVGGECC